MNNDLISRKAVLDVLDELCVMDNVYRAIDNIPVGFDIDKVVERIEENTIEMQDKHGINHSVIDGDTALYLIRQGSE